MADKENMNLKEIISQLSEIPGVRNHPAFVELERIGVQHPDLVFVQWYECRACRKSHPGSRSCASPFLPEECLQMFDEVEPIWVPIEWDEMKKRGIRKGDAHLG